MFKRLVIQNFQSHEKSVLDFSPGVNVIVGESDAGKSAIIRAFRWLIDNKPGGDAFRSWWGGATKVVAHADRLTIQRVRDGKENHYAVGDEDYKAIGQGVPPEVAEALNMHSINMQSQMDQPYMLGNAWSGGECARELNEAAGLEIIDTVLSDLNSKKRANASAIQAEEARHSSTELQLNNLPDLAAIEKAVEQVEAQSIKAETKRREEHKLRTAIEAIKEAKEDVEDYEDKSNLLPKLSRLMEKDDKAAALNEKIETLSALLGRLRKGDEYMKQESKELNKLEKEYEAAMPDVCPLCGGRRK